jgi:hypothetical protein
MATSNSAVELPPHFTITSSGQPESNRHRRVGSPSSYLWTIPAFTTPWFTCIGHGPDLFVGRSGACAPTKVGLRGLLTPASTSGPAPTQLNSGTSGSGETRTRIGRVQTDDSSFELQTQIHFTSFVPEGGLEPPPIRFKAEHPRHWTTPDRSRSRRNRTLSTGVGSRLAATAMRPIRAPDENRTRLAP